MQIASDAHCILQAEVQEIFSYLDLDGSGRLWGALRQREALTRKALTQACNMHALALRDLAPMHTEYQNPGGSGK